MSLSVIGLLFSCNSSDQQAKNDEKDFKYLVDEFADIGLNVTIPAKSFAYQTVVVTTTMILLFGILLALIIPMAFIVCGVVISFVRRKR